MTLNNMYIPAFNNYVFEFLSTWKKYQNEFEITTALNDNSISRLGLDHRVSIERSISNIESRLFAPRFFADDCVFVCLLTRCTCLHVFRYRLYLESFLFFECTVFNINNHSVAQVFLETHVSKTRC